MKEDAAPKKKKRTGLKVLACLALPAFAPPQMKAQASLGIS